MLEDDNAKTLSGSHDRRRTGVERGRSAGAQADTLNSWEKQACSTVRAPKNKGTINTKPQKIKINGKTLVETI